MLLLVNDLDTIGRTVPCLFGPHMTCTEYVNGRHLRSGGKTFSEAQPQVVTEGGRQRRQTSIRAQLMVRGCQRLQWHRPTGIQGRLTPLCGRRKRAAPISFPTRGCVGEPVSGDHGADISGGPRHQLCHPCRRNIKIQVSGR